MAVLLVWEPICWFRDRFLLVWGTVLSRHGIVLIVVGLWLFIIWEGVHFLVVSADFEKSLVGLGYGLVV